MGKKEVTGGPGITAGGNVTFGDVTGDVEIGEFIKIENPSGEALIKLIDHLGEKRDEAFNKEILSKYAPSELPNYPSQLKEFVTHNRADEITKDMIYFQDHRILLISGIGGVGKTTLARALVETRPANVPLPFWFDFGKKTDATLGDVLEKLAGYMNAPGIAKFRAEKRDAKQDDIDKLTGELQRREQLWLIFDNVETILDDRYFHDNGMDLLFTSLRGSTHNAKIIVTSRILPLLRNGDSLIDIMDEKRELKGLKLNFAIDFLVKNGLEVVEREKLEELATGVDGHPLALRLLIELVKEIGVSDTLKDLSLFQKSKEDTIKKARRLFEKLAGDEKELLEGISVFRRPEFMTAIKSMFTERTAADAIRKLINKSLLETDLKGNYWLHPLIREFSYDDLKNKIDVHKSAYQYYLSLPLPEKRTKKDDVQPLIEAQYHACKAEEYDEAASIIFDKSLNEDLDRWGEYRTLVDLYTGVLPKYPLLDKTLLSDINIHSAVLGKLGNVYRNLGQVERAIQFYGKALAIAQEIEDERGEGNALGNLGLAYFALGKTKQAIYYHQQALTIAREIDDRRGEGTLLGYLGLAYRDLGQAEDAIKYHLQALAIAHEMSDRRSEATHLGNLGLAYRDLGQVNAAICCAEQNLAISREIGDRRGEGIANGHLGTIYRESLKQIERAIYYHQEAITIAREMGDRRHEGIWLGQLGLDYCAKGQTEDAIKYSQQALDISRGIGDRRHEGIYLDSLGLAYRAMGQMEHAIHYHQQALFIIRQIGDRRSEATFLGNLGYAYRTMGQVKQSIDYYKQSLAIFEEIKSPSVELVRKSLNDLAAYQKNPKSDVIDKLPIKSRKTMR